MEIERARHAAEQHNTNLQPHRPRHCNCGNCRSQLGAGPHLTWASETAATR